MRTPAMVVLTAALVAGDLGEERAMVEAPSLAARLAAVRDRWTCRITTRGRRSGKPHTVTTWFVTDGSTLYVATPDASRDWSRNVQRTPAVEIDIDGLRVRGQATLIADPAVEGHVRDLFAAKYWLAWIRSWFPTGPARAIRVDGLETS